MTSSSSGTSHGGAQPPLRRLCKRIVPGSVRVLCLGIGPAMTMVALGLDRSRQRRMRGAGISRLRIDRPKAPRVSGVVILCVGACVGYKDGTLCLMPDNER